MRSLTELACPGLRGVFSDIDDTLTHDGAVVPEAYAALARARKAGLRVVLVTGRPAGWAEVLASVWPVDAAIAENGGIAFLRRGRRIERLYFAAGDPREDAQRLADLSAEIERAHPFAKRTDDATLRVTDIAFDIGENEALPAEQIEAITSLARSRGARTIVSSVHAHACFHEADKAQMSARVAGVLWNESPEDVARNYAFVGDSPNDQAAFAFFETSIGVANVARYAAALAPPPAFITTAAYGHGFAEAIDAILAQRAR
jgi:HAD superfamily hydrolase (TIGR01484 family)